MGKNREWVPQYTKDQAARMSKLDQNREQEIDTRRSLAAFPRVKK